MNYLDYYNVVDSNELINPKDLSKPMEVLIAKAETLDQAEAPRMLTRFMFSLVLEIEIGRRNSPAIINPKNPDPLTVPILTKDTKDEEEKLKIIEALKRSGWTVGQVSGSLIQLSVTKSKAKRKSRIKK